MRSPVIIIGSHRSGTSATTRALHELGLFLGAGVHANQFADSERHFEAPFFYRLHEQYMAKVGATWYRPEPLIEHLASAEGESACRDYLRWHVDGRFGGGQAMFRRYAGLLAGCVMPLGYPMAWGWKDPRSTLFIASWLNIFPESKVVHIVRHPLDVALSLHSREKRWREQEIGTAIPELESLDYCFTLVEQYVACGLRASQITKNYREWRFEDIQSDPQNSMRELAEFCDITPDAQRLRRAISVIDGNRRSRWSSMPQEDASNYMARYRYTDRFHYNVTPTPAAIATTSHLTS